MKVDIESVSARILRPVKDSIISDVTSALNKITTVDGKFLVNDTLWFWKNPKGKVKPSVVNSASYITKNFQDNLENLGWTKEPTIDEQRFDAMDLVFEQAKLYSLREEDFLPLLKSLRDGGKKGYGLVATELFRDFVLGSRPFLPDETVGLAEVFQTEAVSYGYRIGLEFETGNIASSFRSIDKLQGLYDSGQIDIGVFITSKSKADGAARIWPVSNRNGSFVELRQRGYEARRTYPHIDISFRPDGYDKSAPYFSETATYSMQMTNETEAVGGILYTVALSADGVRKLRPQSQSTLL